MSLGIIPNVAFANAPRQSVMLVEAEAAARKLRIATAALEIHTAASTVHRAIDSNILSNLLSHFRR
jgi:DNA-directed RNA polymerase specialized sigma54-like protein